MPDITISVPTEAVPRIKEAWEASFQRLEGETDAQFFRRGVAELVKEQVRLYEHRKQLEGIEATTTDEVAM